jgi:hypothetical protein
MRNFLVGLLVGGLTLSALSSVASAQSAGTGAVTGQVILCGSLPRPVPNGSAEPATDFTTDGVAQPQPVPDPSGVTPGVPKRGKLAPAAANVEVSVEGTSITVRTDGDGRFFLVGVPADEPLTLQAQRPSARSPIVLRPNLIVGPGQTVDLGTMEMGDCLRTLLPMTSVQSEGGTGERSIAPPSQSSEFELAPAEDQPVFVDGWTD